MRIISGRFGGRTLVAPRGDRTRPTSDKVRQALFNVLREVDDLDVLDLYAGTGALGLEALSRGARSALFVERDRTALGALERNVRALGVEPVATWWADPVERALDRLRGSARRFGLVFSDPPYDAAVGAHRALLSVLDTVLTPDGRAVLELDARDALPGLPSGLSLLDERRYGDTALALVGRSDRDSDA